MTQVIEHALRIEAPPTTEREWALVHGRLRNLGEQPLGRAWRMQVLALCTPEMGMSDPGSMLAIEPSDEERAELQQLREVRSGNRSQRFRELAARPFWS